MTENKTLKIATAAVMVLALTTNVFAKDWIEKVEVKRDGIDVVPVEVSANAHKYTGIKSGSHRFLLRLYAKATSGERIVAMKVGSFKGVRYFEGDGNLWSKSFAHRDVGSGSKRTVAINYTPKIPLSKIKWQGWNPREVCALNMDKKIKGGMTKAQVLAKSWTVKAKAYFELDAVAARKNKAKNNKWNIGNTTDQRDGYGYEVSVKCNAGL